MPISSLEDFYRETALLIPENINREIGHFNVFRIEDIIAKHTENGTMPYNRRAYYKISLINGRNQVEYADKIIEIEKHGLLFATPRIPYHYVPYDNKQSGQFCIFTHDFLVPSKTGIVVNELPIFKPGSVPVFKVSKDEVKEITSIFEKMRRELASSYAFKYDLIRNYVIELIHFGQKLNPATTLYSTHNASARVSSLFIELLERQFPIESPQQKLSLRSPNEFAEMLSVHVNHLNKVLKENTAKTTKELIDTRVMQEAKILLKQTSWSISEIAFCLGFEEVAHFSNFFKKHASVAPLGFRAN
jgi:AraC family transcriptional regulator, transcriptional activator of pobA